MTQNINAGTIEFGLFGKVPPTGDFETVGIGRGLDSLASALLARQANSTRIIIAPDAETATRIKDDITFFAKLARPQEGEDVIRLFPSFGAPVYGKLSPSLSNRFSRLDCLHQLVYASGERITIITHAQALSQLCIAKEDFLRETIELSVGSDYEFSSLGLRLQNIGYAETANAEDPSTYSIRGGIIDIFPPNKKFAYRLDFFDNTLETIRFYNPGTQRTLTEETAPNTIHLSPIRDIITRNENIERARLLIREWCDSREYSRADRSHVLDQLANHIVPLEMDFLAPFFSDRMGSILDFLPADAEVIWIDRSQVETNLEKWHADVESKFKKAVANREIAAPPEQLFAFSIPRRIANVARNIFFEPIRILNEKPLPQVELSYKEIRFKEHLKHSTPNHDSLLEVYSVFQSLQERRFNIFFIANTQAQLDRFSFLLGQKGIKSFHLDTTKTLIAPPENNQVLCAVGKIGSSFCFEDAKVAFISEDAIFGKKKHNARSNEQNVDATLAKDLRRTSLDELADEDLVVHVEHGVARFKGLTKLKSGGILADYALLQFAGADKLYLPIYRLEKIQKYVGDSNSSPALDKLGGTSFLKHKEKAKESIKDIAAKLLTLYAKRSSVKGHSFSIPEELYTEFESSFPYDETPDQLKAIREVEADLQREQPMDRLVCGDVGYGKTEVAMRAAFIAASDGKQVAVLVPTTVLSEQHLQSFRRRFEGLPFSIESLSRFRSRKEQGEIIKGLENGTVDIVIGTHRLLSRDVKFKDLGLIIVDEEQRFGVEHKEKLKKLRLSTDVLTLTATPIPRTLNLSLLGLRDISIIHTPPVDRLSIKTHICAYDDEVIRSAIQYEISRGGQVFFIHNRVQSIPTVFRAISELLPNLKIGVAHGQMPEKDLENVMLGFYRKEFDVLLATAIIENGLDISSANTILINRADTFGLSQLYQIRGRVGRSQLRAYAYFLLPEDRQITEEAKDRLQVMQRHSELGSGFMIASNDLELRGAGDIIGASQSGHVAKIGFDLFMELLEEEILRLRGEEKKEVVDDIEIHAPYPAFIPEDYVKDTRSRLALYRKFSDFQDEESIDDGQAELRERYGEFPAPVTNLVWLIRVKVLMRRYGMKTLRVSADKFSLEGGSNPKIDVTKLMQLIAKNSKAYSFSSDSKLIVRRNNSSFADVFDGFRGLISAIADL